MEVVKISPNLDKKTLLHKLGVTKAGIEIMTQKMHTHLFFIKGLKSPAANILKQDALSIGAELAVEKDTILCKDPVVDALLIANEKQCRLLVQKERTQPFGLKVLASILKEHLDTLKHNQEVKIMGVLNANDDSFFRGSRFLGQDAIKAIEKMIEEGADIIDIGAVSSRPGSVGVSPHEELARLKPILDLLYQERLYEKVLFSLDSYEPLALSYALERGFRIVNDITGLSNDEVCRLAATYKAEVVLMHMQNSPKTMQINPSYENVLVEVEQFFKERIEKAERFGIEDIVLDVGIGFGKRLEDNLSLIKHLGHFLSLGKPLLIGASRKSLIDQISPAPVEERLPGSLILHVKAVEHGASIVRTHDVKAHKQALRVHQALQETLV